MYKNPLILIMRLLRVPRVFAICLFLYARYGVESKAGLKFTNAYCESFNKSWVVINECRLRAIKRDVTVLNINITFLQPAYKIKLSSSFKKKANGYKPFVLDFDIDACDYIVKKNNAIANVVYSFFKNFSNINHTCPYYGDQLVRNFYPRSDLIKLVFPSGEYALLMNWFLSKAKSLLLTYILLSMDEFREAKLY